MSRESARGKPRAQPGGHKLRREVVEHHQRERILAGAAKAIAEEGYRQASVADIVKAAAIARARFYENFSSKQDCFFSLYDETAAAARAAVSEACGTEADAPFAHRVRIALEALVTYLSCDPVLARAIIIEGPAVGPPIASRFEGLIAGFADLLREARPSSTPVELPHTIDETVVGGVYWLLYYAFLDETPRGVEEMLPQLTEFLLIPFVGADVARNASAAA
jgi:AcrR family transcriptional regulator